MIGGHHMIGRIVCVVFVFVIMSTATTWADERIFINGREVSSKTSGGKTSAAFPDVAKTPESPPAGPIPIPYPNMGRSADTAKGSKKIKADGNPVMMKGSKFSTSNGDEAGVSEPSAGTKKLKSQPKRRVVLKNEQDLKEESEQNQLP
jgi:hypothetical protein